MINSAMFVPRAARTDRLLLVMLLLAALLLPTRAQAHGNNTGPTQVFTQAVGPYELAVMLELPTTQPGTVFIDITPQGPIPDVLIELRAAPRGLAFEGRPVAQLRGLAGSPITYFSQLNVDQAGDWQLEVRASGAQGSGVAYLPFTLAPATISGTTLGLAISLAGLGLLLLVSIVITGSAARRARPAPAWLTTLLGQAMFACLIVAAVFGGQQWLAGTNQVVPTSGRPHANLVLSTQPALPLAGQPTRLELAFSDGGTGLPIDDLVPHHESLLHLIVLDTSGEFMAHLHPARSAPGRFVVELTPTWPGRYTAYAEIERRDSGTQVVARPFQVSGSGSPPAPASEQGFGTRQVGDLTVTMSASQSPLRAARQTTLSFNFAQAGQPVLDIQPWLGMAGHLIARSADAQIFGHIHAAAQMVTPGPAASGVRFGPEIQFVYTFPEPGRYRLWAQFKHQDAIVTVPLQVVVE